MKRYLVVVLMTVLLALGVIAGCSQEATPVLTTSATSVPARTQDEVCALVYTYLETKVNLISPLAYRMKLTDTLSKAKSYFTAKFESNGKWQVSALGLGVQINLDEYKETFNSDDRQKIDAASPTEIEQWVKLHEKWFMEQHYPSTPEQRRVAGVSSVFEYSGGLWNFYEVSGVVEPANGEALELLRYIQRWVK